MVSWLAWKVGNGLQVVLGVDTFIGGDHIYKLLEPLCDYLNNMGFNYLGHIRNLASSVPLQNYWLSANDIGFVGTWAIKWSTWAIKWNHFIDGLNYVGIKLSEEPDSLVWG